MLLPRTHPLAGRAGLGLSDLTDARWIDAPGVAPPLSDLRHAAGTDGFRAALGYDGSDVRILGSLVAAGHGLALCRITRRRGWTGWPPSRSSRPASRTGPSFCTPRSRRGRRPKRSSAR